MKYKLIITVLLILILVGLTACYGERGYAFRHLQEMDVGSAHDSLGDLDNDTELELDHNNFENLQNIGLSDHCQDKFTTKERDLYDLEQRAIVERDPDLCEDIPGDLLIDCPGEDPYLYYSKQRCLELSTVN